MNTTLPENLGPVPIEWLLLGLPALLALVVFLLVFGGDNEAKQTRRRVERIRVGNAPQMTPEQIISIRRASNDSGIAIVDDLIKQLLPRPELLPTVLLDWMRRL